MLAYQHDTGEQTYVGNPAGDKFLVCRNQGLGPGIEEGEQAVQRQAGAYPGQCQHQQIVCHHQQRNRGQRQHQAADIACLAAFTVQIMLRVANDHPADKAHQQQHEAAQNIAAQAQVQHAEFT